MINSTREVLPWVLGKIRPLVNYLVGSYLLEDKGEVFGEIIGYCELEEGFVNRTKDLLTNGWMDLTQRAVERIDIGLKCPGLKRGSILGDERWVSSPILDRERITGLLYMYGMG